MTDDKMDDSKIDIKNLGSLLKFKRKELNLTQADVAKRIGVSEQHYSRIERGKYTPSLQTFFKLVKVLGINLSIVDSKDNKNFSSTVYEILGLLGSFNNTQQQAVLSFLKTMKPLKV